ncbi:MAG: TRAP transporter large permease [Bdellovibrionales bacterium]|nr:TRAP transporter large permease [Bdellovibrionales bacterium]
MTIILILVLLALVAISAPLFTIVGVMTGLSLLFFTDLKGWQDLRLLVQHMENLATKQEFLAIPLFMASGAIMTAGGIAKRLVDLMRALLGWMPGGLAIAAVAACMFFAAISGSSPVTLIAVGSMMVPALTQNKYPENFSLGLITTAGSLGCLVPPSISMLIYAISVSGASAVDPSDLFLAGLVPAFLIAGLLAVYSFWVGLGLKEKRPKFSWKEVGEKAREGLWSCFLPILVLGGIYGGWYTPSQAGAVAVAYSLFLVIWVYGELDLKGVIRALMDAGALMGTLLPIIVLAFGLNEFLALVNVQEKFMNLIRQINPSPAQFMLITNVLLIVLGALMDSISATLIFAPLLAPVAQEMFGIHPLHFGVVFVVNMEIGYLMPPVATNLFVASAVFKKPFSQVARAVMPTLGITCAALVWIMYSPTLSLMALNLRDGKPLAVSFPWNGVQAGTPAATAGGMPSLKSLTGKVMDGMKDSEAEEGKK